MSVNDLLNLCDREIGRLHEENDHPAAILMTELCERLRAARDGKPVDWGGGINPALPPARHD